MKTIVHEVNGQKIAEITGEDILIRSSSDALQLMMDVSYSVGQKLILHKSNISDDFFSLKTGLAGDILQKAANYRMQIAIVGDFENLKSESLKAFIVESNQGKQTFFLKDVPSAVTALLKFEV